MKCRKARGLLYEHDYLEFLSPEFMQAREHLNHCSACQNFFKAEDKFKNFLRQEAPREEALASLREEIFTQIARIKKRGMLKDKFPYRLFKKVFPAVAVLIMVLVGSIIYFQAKMAPKTREILNSHQGHSIIPILMEDHFKYNRVGNLPTFSSTSNEEVESWFTGKVGFPVKLPVFKGPRLLGGRLCQVRDTPLALISYKKASERVSLFIMEESKIDLTSLEEFHLADKTFFREKGKRCHAILWKERSLTYIMISELTEEQLADMLISG